MKAKDLVAQVANSQEYQELCRLWEIAVEQAERVSIEILDKMLDLTERLQKRMSEAETQFLEQITASYRSIREAPGIIRISSQSGIPNVQAGQEAFLRQVQQQMPIFWTLLHRIKESITSK